MNLGLKPALALGLLGGVLLGGTAAAQAADQPDWQWGGSLRSLNLAGDAAPADLAPSYRLSSTRLRLEQAWQPAPDWRLETAIDHQLLGRSPHELIALPGDGVNRRADLDHVWHHATGWDSRTQLDRLSLGWSAWRGDLTVGRQAIGFGRIALVSPLDIIAPFPPDAIDTVYRPGVDALRATLHYGQDGQFGALAVLGDVSRHNSYLLTWSDNRVGIDLLAIGGSLRERPLVGLGLAGSLGSLGLKAEAAGYHGVRVGTPGGDRDRHFAMAAIEGWYRFDSGVTLVLEYLYNGPGSPSPADYPQVAAAAPAQEGLTTLLGRHYLLATPSCELHPLVNLNGLLIWNLDDGSLLLRPTLVLNLADNVTLELFWSESEGEAPRHRHFSAPALIRSEFGSQGDSGGVLLAWSF